MDHDEPGSADVEPLLRQLTAQLRERVLEARELTKEALDELDVTLAEMRSQRE